MPTLDSTAKAAIASPSFAVAWFIYLDISGDPLRFTTFGKDVTFASTGDSDLDGNTFVSFGGKLIEVSDVSNSESGSDALTIQLSGIVSVDSGLVTEIGNKALWQGRLARIWFQIYDETGVTPQGAIVQHYTGYMSKVTFNAKPEEQQIQLSIENYLAFTTAPSNRTYLGQKTYDSADTSAQATLAAANGLRTGADYSWGGGGGIPGDNGYFGNKGNLL